MTNYWKFMCVIKSRWWWGRGKWTSRGWDGRNGRRAILSSWTHVTGANLRVWTWYYVPQECVWAVGWLFQNQFWTHILRVCNLVIFHCGRLVKLCITAVLYNLHVTVMSFLILSSCNCLPNWWEVRPINCYKVSLRKTEVMFSDLDQWEIETVENIRVANDI